MVWRLYKQPLYPQPPNSMSEIEKLLFIGNEKNISKEDWEKTVIGNTTSDLTAALRRCGWDGNGCCSVVLTLDADNSKGAGATFLMRGPTDGKTVAIETSKIWPGASSEATLAIKISDASLFTFSDGSLGSDIVAQERLQHTFYLMKEDRPSTPILEADYSEHGIKQFSLRLTACLSKNSSTKNGVIVKYTILLYPSSMEEMLARYEMAQSPAWPGLRIAEGHVPLLPRPTAAWGCPVVPLTILSGPRDSNTQPPDGEELRSHRPRYVEDDGSRDRQDRQLSPEQMGEAVQPPGRANGQKRRPTMAETLNHPANRQR